MKYKTVFVYAPVGTYEKETLFSGVQTENSPHWIDAPALADECTTACNKLADEGYEVVTMTEVTKGNEQMHVSGGAGWALTHGVLITAKRAG